MALIKDVSERPLLPCIPLRGIVAFPMMPLSLEINREQIKNACEAANKRDGLVFLVLQKDISQENPGADGLYTIGTIAKIKQTVKAADGVLRVLFDCQFRGVSARYIEGPFHTAEMSVCNSDLEFDETPDDLALVRELQSVFSEIARYMPALSKEIILAAKTITEIGVLCDFIALNILHDILDKQIILSELIPSHRAQRLLVMLNSELEVMKAELKIRTKVKAQIDKNQRDYYLREQIKAIEEELGEEDDEEITEYNAAFDKLHLPTEIDEKLRKDIKKLAKSPYSSAESSLLRNYLDTVLELPWNIRTKDRTDISAARKILEHDHYGLHRVKQRILEFLSVKTLNPDIKNQIICLVGPPGVGKTSVASSVARAMKRNYVRASLGGIRDEADIRGHRKTYIGAMPGRIVNAVIQSKSMNPLILLDEVDKLTRDAHGDPASALLEVLDGEQNKSFRDHFLEIPLDLSDCMFICTANTLDTVPKPLIDRMEIIRLDSYTRAEKLAIAKKHLIPKQRKRHGLTAQSFKIDDAAIRYIIDYYTREAGVRALERTLGAIMRRAAMKIADEGQTKVSVKVHNLEEYIDSHKMLPTLAGDADEIGVVNGLAYTEAGGDLLKIEVAVLDGSGKLELTGSLGDVMKESARAAVSYIRSVADKYGIEHDFYKTKDIHIHVPEGAVPKDGPSAGVTIMTALVSALASVPVKCSVAMTGEMTLRGRVLAIGGLKEKTAAAYAAGVTTVLIPQENLCDLRDIDGEIKEHITFIPCKNAQDVLTAALVSEAAVNYHPISPDYIVPLDTSAPADRWL